MARPKPRPRTQNRIPMSNSLWPSIPRKLTEDRSGSLRLASPPTSELGWARAFEAPKVTRATIVARVLAALHPLDAIFASQMRMGFLHREELEVRMTTCLGTAFRHKNARTPNLQAPGAHCRNSEHASTARLYRSAELGRVGSLLRRTALEWGVVYPPGRVRHKTRFYNILPGGGQTQPSHRHVHRKAGVRGV